MNTNIYGTTRYIYIYIYINEYTQIHTSTCTFNHTKAIKTIKHKQVSALAACPRICVTTWMAFFGHDMMKCSHLLTNCRTWGFGGLIDLCMASPMGPYGFLLIFMGISMRYWWISIHLCLHTLVYTCKHRMSHMNSLVFFSTF